MSTSEIYTTGHAKFNETIFPFTGDTSPLKNTSLLFSNFEESCATLLTQSKSSVTSSPTDQVLTSFSTPCLFCSDGLQAFMHEPTRLHEPSTSVYELATLATDASTLPPLTITTTSNHLMITYDKADIYKSCHFHDFISLHSSAVHMNLLTIKIQRVSRLQQNTPSGSMLCTFKSKLFITISLGV